MKTTTMGQNKVYRLKQQLRSETDRTALGNQVRETKTVYRFLACKPDQRRLAISVF